MTSKPSALTSTAPKFSLSLKSNPSNPVPKPTVKPSTPSSLPSRAKWSKKTALHDDDDSDGRSDDDTKNGPQQVSGFDASAGGAIADASGAANGGRDGKAGALVIPKQPNRDWRTESRKRKLMQRGDVDGAVSKSVDVVAAAGAAAGKKSTGGAAQTEEVKYGLQVNTTKKDTDIQVEERNAEPAKPQTELTEDQIAIEALLGNNPNGNANTTIITPEDAAFRTDYASAPDVATLDEYLSVPVEEFGAALLRGMGWREGETPGRRRHQQQQQQQQQTSRHDSKTKQPNVPKERRAALLGIGAKEEAAVGIELGAWGPRRQGKDAAKKVKGRKLVDQVYNPVMLRNKVTGEQLTEEELKLKLEQQKMELLRQKEGGKDGGDGDENRKYGRWKEKDGDRAGERYAEEGKGRHREESRIKESDRDRRKESERSRHRDGDEDEERRRRRRREGRRDKERRYRKLEEDDYYARSSKSGRDRYRER